VLAVILVVKVDAHVLCSWIVHLQLSDGTLFWCLSCALRFLRIYGASLAGAYLVI